MLGALCCHVCDRHVFACVSPACVQVGKLRMLSLVSLAHTSKVVPYATIKTALGIDNVRHLEDVIFDTIYSGLLQGKLDQRQEVLKVR